VGLGGLQLKINGDAPTVKQTFAPHRESEGGWLEGVESERGSGERGAAGAAPAAAINQNIARFISVGVRGSARRPLLRSLICCQHRCRTRSETNSIFVPV
jgi:hypothetical protein